MVSRRTDQRGAFIVRRDRNRREPHAPIQPLELRAIGRWYAGAGAVGQEIGGSKYIIEEQLSLIGQKQVAAYRRYVDFTCTRSNKFTLVDASV